MARGKVGRREIANRRHLSDGVRIDAIDLCDPGGILLLLAFWSSSAITREL